MLNARLKKYVFNLDLKVSRLEQDLISNGILFHNIGAEMENDFAP